MSTSEAVPGLLDAVHFLKTNRLGPYQSLTLRCLFLFCSEEVSTQPYERMNYFFIR